MESTIIQRINTFLRDNSISVNALAKRINVAQPTLNPQLKGDRSLSSSIVEKFLREFPEVSAEWIMRGKGSMYIADESDTDSMVFAAEPTPKRHDTAMDKQDESIWKAKYEAIKECYDMLVSNIGSGMGNRTTNINK